MTEEKDIRLKTLLLGEAQECLDKLRLLFSSITKSIQGYDFYPSQDEKDLVKSKDSQFSQIFSSLDSLSTVPDLVERGKLAGQESRSPDPERDHA